MLKEAVGLKITSDNLNLMNLLKANNLKQGGSDIKRIIEELLTSLKLQFNLVMNQWYSFYFPTEIKEIYFQHFLHK